MRPPFDREVRRKAAELLARRDAGWSADEAAEFELWRAADPAHDAAVREIETAMSLLGRLPESPAAAAMLQELNELEQQRHAGRQPRWTLWASALAAAACILFVLWRVWPAPVSTIPYAALGQARSVDLTDGSTLQMKAGSRVEVAFVAAERRVVLQVGEVHFSVAKNPARPFIVAAGNIRVRAVGTAFDVRREAAAIGVTVTEGKVGVTRESGAPHDELFLVAGETATIRTDVTQPLRLGRPILTGALAANRAVPPRLEFANTPLAEVVDRFNHYSRVQLELADPELATRPVGGTFNADQAEVFVNLLVAAGDVSAERVSETHIVLHRAR